MNDLTPDALKELKIMAKEFKWLSGHIAKFVSMVEPHTEDTKIKNQLTIFDIIKKVNNEDK